MIDYKEFVNYMGEYNNVLPDSITQQNVDNLFKHADFIENIESKVNGKKFNMSVFYEVDYETQSIDNFKDCNSVMCAIGWAKYNNDLIQPSDDDNLFSNNYILGWREYSCSLFGISDSGIGSFCFDCTLPSDPELISNRMRQVASYFQYMINQEET